MSQHTFLLTLALSISYVACSSEPQNSSDAFVNDGATDSASASSSFVTISSSPGVTYTSLDGTRLSNGTVAVVWTEESADGTRALSRVLASDGAPVTDVVVLDQGSAIDDITTASVGPEGFVSVWIRRSAAASGEIQTQAFGRLSTLDGSGPAPIFSIGSAGPVRSVMVAGSEIGAFAVEWVLEYNTHATFSQGLVQQIASDGSAIGASAETANISSLGLTQAIVSFGGSSTWLLAQDACPDIDGDGCIRTFGQGGLSEPTQVEGLLNRFSLGCNSRSQCVLLWSEFDADNRILARLAEPNQPFVRADSMPIEVVNAARRTESPRTAIAANGEFIVVWSGDGVFARTFAPDGSATSEVIEIASAALGYMAGAHVVSLDDGNYLVFWFMTPVGESVPAVVGQVVIRDGKLPPK